MVGAVALMEKEKRAGKDGGVGTGRSGGVKVGVGKDLEGKFLEYGQFDCVLEGLGG